MKANELMVNDWVRPIGCNPFRVGCVLGDAVCNDSDTQMWCDDEIEPIPLTAEILEKNGFECRGAWCIPGESMGLRQNRDEWDIITFYGAYTSIPLCNIRYVHELQHALRLCKIKKEIVL